MKEQARKTAAMRKLLDDVLGCERFMSGPLIEKMLTFNEGVVMHKSYLDNLLDARQRKMDANAAFDKAESAVMNIAGARGKKWYHKGYVIEVTAKSAGCPGIYFETVNLPNG